MKVTSRLSLLVAILSFFGFLHSARAGCPGDINGDHEVTIDEIVRSVNAALQGCESFESCGDGVVQSALGEDCDGSNLAGGSCSMLGFSGGTLACTASCKLNTTGCTTSGGGGLLATGQSQCDQGSGSVGACPGSPAGQDGALHSGTATAYSDNGDGTVIDNVTGLQWEKLSDDDGIHDWNNAYTWYDAFTVKITALNAAPCFAGHCDWRLPNRRELDSLVDIGRASPAIHPLFNTACDSGCAPTACSCTQSDNYWSSSTYQDPGVFPPPGFAWTVEFNFGAINGFDKTIPAYYVRAVRAGK